MSVHEQFAEDLALYALGAREGDGKVSLEKHLQECASCRRELEQLRGDAALLALSTAGPRPPERAKTRLMNGMANEPRTQPSRLRINWWAAIGWGAAAAMLVFVIGVSRQNKQMHSTVAQLARIVEQERVSARENAESTPAPGGASILILTVAAR